jgi:putative ABC transport system permease protein
MSLRRSWARLTAIWTRRRLDEELEDDIRAHLALAEEEATARGMSAEAARMEARRHFGGIARMKEEHHDRRSFRFLETIAKDLRYGLAGMRRTPGFAIIAIGVLGLGVGGTVAMFSVVDAVLVKPLPFAKPDRIVAIWEAPRPGVVNATSVPQFLAWERLSANFATLSAERGFPAVLNDESGPVRLAGKQVTADYFKVFGTGAGLGRTFRAGEDQAGADAVVVLSNSAWRIHFGGDPKILQKRVGLNGQSYQVIGVLEPSAFDRDQTEFWTPLVFEQAEKSSAIHGLMVYGRLRDGLRVEEARQRMQAIYTALMADSAMDEDPHYAMVVRPLSQLLLGSNLQMSMAVAFGAVVLVLLIACANVANLLFARGAARRTELAVRVALGAGRGRLIGQLLTECLVLCALGGAAGVGIAFAFMRAAKPALADALPFTAEVRLNGDALLFAIVVVLGVALFTGALPAWYTSFSDLADSLKQASRGLSGAHWRVRRSIVIGEVALSLVLVCGALLLSRSLLNLQRVDAGVRIENVVTTSVDLSADAYGTAEKAAQFCGELAPRLQATPGVMKAGMATVLPLHWISNGEGLFIPGVAKPVTIRLKRVDAGYLSTLDIPVLAGRGIGGWDRMTGLRVILINQALAKSLADVADIRKPVGAVVRLTGSDYLGQKETMTDVQIVGVIRNERTTSPGAEEPPVVYVPLAQVPNQHVKILIRTREGFDAVMPGIRKAVREVDPNLPLGEVATMQEIKAETLSGVSRPAGLITAFAGVALLLTGVGLYGVISYSLTQRRKEFAIRVALGARPATVLRQVLRGALGMVGVGLVLGLAGVDAMTRILNSFLFEVSPLDPFSLLLGCVVMATIGLAAALIPALRAARFDPMFILREDG